MSVIKNSVLLLKSERTEDSNDKYEDLLRSKNFEVMTVKTLTFQYKNLDILREKLSNPDNFSGIVFSSPRCVNATHQALSREKIQELWGAKSNFAVGVATHDLAVEKLGIHCRGKESGNAENLAQVIINEKANFMKPFLFPHGNLKTGTLQDELGKEGLAIEGVLVYDTLPNPHIGDDLAKISDNFRILPEFVVFFSPSGLSSSISYLRRIQVLDFVKIIAIGPVTQAALSRENLKVFAVAKDPTPEGVLAAFM